MSSSEEYLDSLLNNMNEEVNEKLKPFIDESKEELSEKEEILEDSLLSAPEFDENNQDLSDRDEIVEDTSVKEENPNGLYEESDFTSQVATQEEEPDTSEEFVQEDELDTSEDFVQKDESDTSEEFVLEDESYMSEESEQEEKPYTSEESEQEENIESAEELDIEDLLNEASQNFDDEISEVDIEQMMEEDEDLNAIRDMLAKSDQDEMIVDDSTDEQDLSAEDAILQMLGSQEEELEYKNQENVSEDLTAVEELLSDENLSSKKNKKKGSKKKYKVEEEKIPKEKGKLALFIERLFESDEDDEKPDKKKSENDPFEIPMGDEVNSSDLESIIPSKENKEIMDELDAEEEEGKGKKKKKKDKKEKKEKKEKKPKKEKKEAEVDDSKPLNKKSVRRIFVLAFSLLALVLIIIYILPSMLENAKAKSAYMNEDYMSAYLLLYGKDLSESNQVILTRSTLILQLERKIDMYQYNKTLLNDKEAIDSLLQGIARYQEFYEKAVEYAVTDKFNEKYQEILNFLNSDYGIDESTALQIVAYEDDYDYTKHIESILDGTPYPSEDMEPEQTIDEMYPDVLPEEYDMLTGTSDTTTDTTEESTDTTNTSTETNDLSTQP